MNDYTLTGLQDELQKIAISSNFLNLKKVNVHELRARAMRRWDQGKDAFNKAEELTSAKDPFGWPGDSTDPEVVEHFRKSKVHKNVGHRLADMADRAYVAQNKKMSLGKKALIGAAIATPIIAGAAYLRHKRKKQQQATQGSTEG